MSGKAAAVPPAATPAAAGDHAGFCCHCANSLEEWAEVLAQAEEDGDDEVELLVCSDCKRTMCERCFNYDDDRRIALREEAQVPQCEKCAGRCSECRAAKAKHKCEQCDAGRSCDWCRQECDGCHRPACAACFATFTICKTCGHASCENCACSTYKGNCDCQVERLNRGLRQQYGRW